MQSSDKGNNIQRGFSSKVADVPPLDFLAVQAARQIRFLEMLEDENRVIQAELALQKKRYSKLKKILFVASAPWLILLAPLTIIWVAKRIVRKQRKDALSSEFELAQGKKLNRNKILYAFLWLQSVGLDRALTKLDEDPETTPKGARALFKAYEASDDTAWAEATNRWLAYQSQCRVIVTPGDGPRFKRLSFSKIAPIESGQKISVIMPAFNAEKWIEPAVGSILNQSWRNLELIVVNDKSTDRTGEILNDLAQTDSRLRVLHNPVNVGPYVSKNVALSFASGDFVTGHDADDIALPDRLHRQVNHLISNPCEAGVIGQMIRVDETGALSVASKISGTSFDGIHRTAMISLMVRRDVIDRFGYWDCVRFGADSEYRARLSTYLGRHIKTVPDLTMICLSAPESLTNDPDYGLIETGGMSPIRIAYRDNWLAWHKANRMSAMHREFSNASRPFDAPREMLVPQADIETLQSHYNVLR